MNPYRNDPCGPWRGPRGSYYGRGNVKFAILDLLKEKPRHGYDIIREMEERSGGAYSPSPGVIYPTLQALEDQDFVKSVEQDGKKVYSITEGGLAYLQGQKEARRGEGHHSHGRHGEDHHGAGGPGRAGGAGGQPPQGEGPHGKEGPNWVHTGPSGAAAWGSWFASSGGPELMREMRWMFGDVATGIQRTLGDREKLNEIRDVLREAKAKIDQIVLR
jgi:DNA-binding PadR family transcriptional regulator